MPQDFAKWEAFVRYIFVVSFISLAFAAVQLWFSIHEMVPFWRFWALLPQIMFDLAEILTKGKVPTRQTLFEKSFEILNIGSNGIHPKFTVFVHFGAPFTAGKPKILLETEISGKTTFLGIWNNVSLRSQKNHGILIKLSKNIFLVQMGCKLLSGVAPKDFQKFAHSYNRTIHLYFLDAKFQLLGICCSWIYLEEATTFFGSGRFAWDLFFICFISFLFLVTITPVNNVRLS